jgi:hypothetical protein
MGRWLSGLCVLLAAGAAAGQGADVALANLVSGNVTLSPASGGPVKALPAFSRIRDGDRIEIAVGSQVRVVFFKGARQERWVGPASFRARTGGAEPVSGKPAETSTLPAEVSQRIARVPELVQYARLGGIQVRGGVTPAQKASLEQQEAVAKARATYQALRTEAAADDITPELFLYSTLYDYLLYDDMKVVVEEMLRRQPGSGDVKALAAFVREQLARRKNVRE